MLCLYTIMPFFMAAFLSIENGTKKDVYKRQVSAVPMAARVSQKVGADADPSNFLLMHAMGPNVAGVIGTAVAAGTFMAIFGV